MTPHHVYVPRSRYKHLAASGAPGFSETKTYCGKSWANYATTIVTASRPLCPSCSSLFEQERRSEVMTTGMSHFGHR